MVDGTLRSNSRSTRAATTRSSGYDADLVEVAGACHLTVVFHDFFDGKVASVPDEPAGNEVARMILNTIAATLGVRLQSDPESNRSPSAEGQPGRRIRGQHRMLRMRCWVG